MLPYACLDSMSYTDELYVYYSTQSQTAMGIIRRTWTYDRIERGLFVPTLKRMYDVDTQNTWRDILNGHTEEDLRIDSQGNLYAPSEVLVMFKYPSRIETAGVRKGKPTTYELRGSTPIEGPFGEVLHFDTQLFRSLKQEDDVEVPILNESF
jgi:hypothetical protein